jgi:DNA-directed RNA polymerase specialized sigma24 family protein
VKLTAEQRAAVIVSAVAGDCHEGIAAEIGCSRRTVSRIVKASAVVVRPPRPVPCKSTRAAAPPWLDWRRIAALNAEGLWVTEIARRVECSDDAVRYALRQMGLRQNYKRASMALRYGGE